MKQHCSACARTADAAFISIWLKFDNQLNVWLISHRARNVANAVVTRTWPWTAVRIELHFTGPLYHDAAIGCLNRPPARQCNYPLWARRMMPVPDISDRKCSVRDAINFIRWWANPLRCCRWGIAFEYHPFKTTIWNVRGTITICPNGGKFYRRLRFSIKYGGFGAIAGNRMHSSIGTRGKLNWIDQKCSNSIYFIINFVLTWIDAFKYLQLFITVK